MSALWVLAPLGLVAACAVAAWWSSTGRTMDDLRAVAERQVMTDAIHELIAAHSVKHIPGIPGYESLTGFSRCECGGYELPCPTRAGLEKVLDPDGKAVERIMAALYRPAADTFEEAFARWRADGAPDVAPEVDVALAMFETGDEPWFRPRDEPIVVTEAPDPRHPRGQVMSEVRVSCEVAEVLSLVPHVEVWSSLTNYVGDRVVDPRLPPMTTTTRTVRGRSGRHILIVRNELDADGCRHYVPAEGVVTYLDQGGE